MTYGAVSRRLDAFPIGIEFAPAGYTMDIHVQFGARKRGELIPGEQQRFLYLTPDSECPIFKVQTRHRTVMQDQEAIRQVPPRGQAFLDFRI